MTDIVDLLDIQLHAGHDRGCQGRTYSCDCGYDSEGEDLLRAAKAEIEQLRRQLNELRAELYELFEPKSERRLTNLKT